MAKAKQVLTPSIVRLRASYLERDREKAKTSYKLTLASIDKRESELQSSCAHAATFQDGDVVECRDCGKEL